MNGRSLGQIRGRWTSLRIMIVVISHGIYLFLLTFFIALTKQAQPGERAELPHCCNISAHLKQGVGTM